MNEKNAFCGALIADKPEGFTSFDLCAKLRGMLRTKRIGHTGTLDPMATGVMVILLGAATRAADLLPDHDKTYRAAFRLGVTTDTLDSSGKILSSGGYKGDLSRENILAVLDRFRGEISQLPPMFSAVQVDGRRLYDIARSGAEVERAPRKVTVFSLELAGFDSVMGEGELYIMCSKGTYIRSIIADMGSALGTGAVLTGLRRTAACGFTLDDALSIGEIQRLSDAGEIGGRILPVDRIFSHCPRVAVSAAQGARYRNGGDLSLDRVVFPQNSAPNEGDMIRVYDTEFIGLGKIQGENLHPFKRFV